MDPPGPDSPTVERSEPPGVHDDRNTPSLRRTTTDPGRTTQPGGLLDRFLARLIDGLVIGIAYIVLSAIFRPVSISGVDSTGELFLFYAVVSILWTALAIGYFAYMENSRGQSLGKMVLKLRTLGPDSANPTLEQGVRRNIFYAIELLAIVPIIGFWLGPLASLAAVIFIAVGINSDTTTGRVGTTTSPAGPGWSRWADPDRRSSGSVRGVSSAGSGTPTRYANPWEQRNDTSG